MPETIQPEPIAPEEVKKMGAPERRVFVDPKTGTVHPVPEGEPLTKWAEKQQEANRER